MEEQKNLGTEAVESPSTVEANVDNSKPTLVDKYFPELVDAPASEEPAEEVEVETSEEAPVDERAGSEGNVDEVSDVEEDIEGAELEESEDADHLDDDEVVLEGSESVVDYDEMKNHVFDIDGKRYTADDIKSVFGQEKAAGTKSREASDKLKEVEAREEELVEREAKLTQRTDAAIASDTMVKLQSEARQINAKIESARAAGDMYDVTMLKDKMEVLGKQYVQEKQKVDIQNQELHSQQIAVVETALKERGLGHLLQDGPAAEAWSGYANSKLTETEANATLMSPGLAEMVEKSRKYDQMQSKVSKKSTKLKTSGKTLKAGTNKPVSSKKTKAQAERRARINTGNATDGDLEQSSQAIISKYFK